jgi:hypothetical protein
MAVAVFTLLGWAIRMAWRTARSIWRFLDDYHGQPARDGLPARPGFIARLTRLETMVSAVVEETKPNGGSSMHDVVHQTASDVLRLRKDVIGLKKQVEGMDSGAVDAGAEP